MPSVPTVRQAEPADRREPSSRRGPRSPLMLLAALILAGPATLAYLRYRAAWGDLREVVVTPLEDGRARVSVLYDFTVGSTPNRQGEPVGGTTWLAWGQDSGWFRPSDDPVLPLAEARQRAERLRLTASDGQRRRLFRVFYRANDPAGTAFIQLGDGGGLTAYLVGMGFVVVSLLLCLPYPRHRRGSPA